MKFSQFVVTEAILPSLVGTNRDEVVKEMIEALVAAGAAPTALKAELIKSILDREKKASTGFGKGVAVPHAKHARIKKMAAAIGVSARGLDFNALDKQPVYSVVLLLSPLDKPDDHLHAMESIFSNLQNETFRRFLRHSTTVQAVTDLLQEADSQQLQG